MMLFLLFSNTDTSASSRSLGVRLGVSILGLLPFPKKHTDIAASPWAALHKHLWVLNIPFPWQLNPSVNLSEKEPLSSTVKMKPIWTMWAPTYLSPFKKVCQRTFQHSRKDPSTSMELHAKRGYFLEVWSQQTFNHSFPVLCLHKMTK